MEKETDREAENKVDPINHNKKCKIRMNGENTSLLKKEFKLIWKECPIFLGKRKMKIKIAIMFF